MSSTWHCRYVVTDDGAQDESMVHVACAQSGIAAADVGDDCWNSMKRITETITVRHAMHSSIIADLKAVYNEVYTANGTAEQFVSGMSAWVAKYSAHIPDKAVHAAVFSQARFVGCLLINNIWTSCRVLEPMLMNVGMRSCCVFVSILLMCVLIICIL